MALTKEQVKHVAKLARIHLSEEAVVTFTNQLGSIFEHLDTLSEVNTAHTAETSQVNGLISVLRADLPEPSLSREDILKPSKRPSQRGMMKVRKSL